MKKTIQEVSAETLKLENILSTASPGEEFTYQKLYELSGIRMDNRGKQFMRSALNRLKLPYEVAHGVGIRVLSPDNAMTIITHKVIKIDNSVKRAEKTTKQIAAREDIMNGLYDGDRKAVTTMIGFYGTIRSFANAAKQIFKRPEIRTGGLIK